MQLIDPLLPRLMEVNIDFHAALFSNAKDNIELAIGVAIQRCRIDSAHHLRTFTGCRIENLRRARTRHDARLRKRDEFDIHHAAPFLARFHHGMQVGQTRRRVDVDMTAHRNGAERRGLADQRIGALDDRRGACQFLLFDSETLTQARDMTMRTPAIANETFIEVNMSVDEPGQHQVPCQIDDLRAVDLRDVPDRCRQSAPHGRRG